MSVIDDYVSSLNAAAKTVVDHIYRLVRQQVPTATEEIYYAMPAFKYKGKGLISVMVNQKFVSLYPFCDLSRLGFDLSHYEHTTGSLHFSVSKPLPDEFIIKILTARQRMIDHAS